MKEVLFEILENRLICPNVFMLEMEGDTCEIHNSGEFVEVQIPGKFLRRPFSVCDWSSNRLTIVYRVSGNGTDILSTLTKGSILHVLTGLGNGFNTKKCGEKPLLISGGVGITPIFCLAKKFVQIGVTPEIVVGFNGSNDIILVNELRSIGLNPYIYTLDGSVGTKGFVSDFLDGIEYSYFYACGPYVMYEAIERKIQFDGEYSLEQRMGCGFGACMGCSIQTLNGPKRICKDGPVFNRSEVFYEH